MSDNGTRAHDYWHGPVWDAFGLTRASYLVVPRRTLQSMPKEWQRKLVDLVNELHAELDPDACDADWTVQRRIDGKFAKDPLANYRHAGPVNRRADIGDTHG